MDSNPTLDEQLRRAVVEKMYLNYFNDSLLKRGIITADQHRKMKVQIASRKPKAPIR